MSRQYAKRKMIACRATSSAKQRHAQKRMSHLKGAGACSCGMELLQSGRGHLRHRQPRLLSAGQIPFAWNMQSIPSHLGSAKENDAPGVMALRTTGGGSSGSSRNVPRPSLRAKALLGKGTVRDQLQRTCV